MKIVRRAKQAFLDAEEKQKKLLSGAAIGGIIGINAADLANYQGALWQREANVAANASNIATQVSEPVIALQRDLPISGPLHFPKR